MYEANWIVLLISLLINFTFTVIYIVEAVQGKRGWGTVILFLGIVVIIFGGSLKLYFQDKAHPNIKYAVFYGFMIIYLYTMITFQCALTYIFVFISLVLYMMYLDYQLIKRIISSIIIINFIKAGYIYLVAEGNWMASFMQCINQAFILLLVDIGIMWNTKKWFKDDRKEVESLMITSHIQEKTYVEVFN